MKKGFRAAVIMVFLFGFLVATCFADEYIGDRIRVTADIAYKSDDPRQQTLDAYVQGHWTGESPTWFQIAPQPCPTVIYVHGGGWLRGDKAHKVFSLEPFLRHGWNALNINYRMGPNTAPDAVYDVLYAMKWLAQNAEKYNIDLQNIVLMGESSGGHLALIAGFLNATPGEQEKEYFVGDKIKIRAIVNLFGISDLEGFDEYMSTESSGKSPVQKWLGEQDVSVFSQAYSPIYYINQNTPPVISFHGRKDSSVPFTQSVNLHDELAKKHVKNRLVIFENGTHGGFSHDEWEYLYKEIFSFLADSGEVIPVG